MVGKLNPQYHIPGDVIFVAVGLIDNNLQPVYDLPSSTYFRQFQKFGKN